MPALTFQSRSINFSLYFDAITIYFKERLDPSRSCDDKNILPSGIKNFCIFLNACGCLSTVENVMCSFTFQQFCSQFSTTATCSLVVNYVHQNDDDHKLYHRDNYSMDDYHIHIKFKSMLTRDDITTYLDLLVENDLMALSEGAAFLNLYDQRFASARTQLETKLTRDKKNDAKIIIREIRSCTDIDILTDLHRHLSSDQFDYLRVRTTNPSESSLYQRADEKKGAVETTSAWAHIEESFTLQMAENIHRDCTSFTPALVKERDSQFKRDYRFFGMNHFCPPNDAAAPQVSPNYLPFTQIDSKKFVTASNRYFDDCLNQGVPPTPTAKKATGQSSTFANTLQAPAAALIVPTTTPRSLILRF